MKNFLKKLGIIILCASIFSSCEKKYDNPTVIFKHQNKKIAELNVKIAFTEEEKANGLRWTESMPENEGMLFLFEKEENLTFVMGHVKIPLNIIFIDENLRIKKIFSAPACDKKDDLECKNYMSKGKYVIETNMGWAKKNNIQINDTVELKININK